MARASGIGAFLAESDRLRGVRGKVDFPAESLRRQHLRESRTCGGEGVEVQP